MTSDQDPLLSDPLLTDVPCVDGFKVLEPCVLYSQLGTGGMGAVYRGRHLNLDIDVAVKCLRKSLAEEHEELIVRFQREARVAATISSENLVRVFDVGKKYGVHFLVMEMVKGETARERVQRKGALEPDEAATIALGAARGLAAAHEKGIIHRDIKPDNILISQEGEVKVADLGLARAAETLDSLKTATRMVMGTPQYMPPEQFKSVASVDARADVWALGATLYFLLIGEDAIGGGPLTEVMYRVVQDGFPDLAAQRPDLSSELTELVARCTRPEPTDRFADAGEVVSGLERYLALSGGSSSLFDPGTGEGAGKRLVSPPPAETLARIKSAIEDGGALSTPAAAVASPAPPAAAPPPPPTSTPAPAAAAPSEIPAATPRRAAAAAAVTQAASAAPRRKAPWVIILLIVVVAAAGGLAWLQLRDRPSRADDPSGAPDPGRGRATPPARGGSGDPAPDPGETRDPDDDPQGGGGDARPDPPEEDPTPPPPTEASLADRLASARAKIRDAGGLAEGMAELKAILGEHPGNPEATSLLATALRARALESQESGDLSAALEACRRSLELETSPATRTLEGTLVAAIENQLEGALVVESPDDGALQGEDRVLISGRIESGGTLELRLGDDVVPVAGGRFLVERSGLEEGDNALVLELREPHGIAVQRRVSVVIDTQPPAVKITEPAVDAWVTPEGVTVAGVARDASLRTVEVAGQAVTVAPDGSFTGQARPAAGAPSVRIVATDALGRSTTVEHPLRFDTTPPSLEVTAPRPGQLTRSSSITIEGRFADAESGFGSLVASAGATPLGAPGKDGSFSFRLRLGRDGRHACEIVARDRAGNETRRRIEVVRDATPPSVQILEPAEGARLTPGAVTVVVSARDTSPIEVTVNGAPARASGDRHTATVQLAGEGSRSFDVVARDRAGNEARMRRSVQLASPMRVPSWARAKDGTTADPTTGLAREVIHPDTGIEMVLVRPGQYWRGAPRDDREAKDDERPRHRVRIARPFYLGRFEVTNEQFRRFQPRHRSGAVRGISLDGATQPVLYVSWSMADAFCRRYGFRLPTEAEWEYAARAGTSTRYPWGDSPSAGRSQANVLGPATRRLMRFDYDTFDFDDGFDVTAPVGRFGANAFGLHDMVGNAMEWCADWYDEDEYRRWTSGATDPTGPTRGEERVVRGGAWTFGPSGARVTRRLRDDPGKTSDKAGFRVARNAN